MSTLKKILRKIAKWTGILLLVLLGLFIIVVVLIRTEWAQNKIVGYATDYASEKTGTRIDIDRLFITFSGNIQLEGLYVEDQKQDTLVYSRSLEAGLGLRSLFGSTIRISRVEWEGLRANVWRNADSTFNFDFIIDAFSGTSDTTTSTSDTSSSTAISFGPIDFADFHILYLDSISGIDAMLVLGELSLTTDNIDFEKMDFEVDELRLVNTKAHVFQFLLPPPGEEDTSSSTLPYISCDNLLLENLDLEYSSTPGSLLAKALIGHFNITEASVDLDKKDISAETFRFLENNLRLQLPKSKPDSIPTAQNTDTASSSFHWPDWKLALEELDFQDNDIQFDRGHSTAPEGIFDPNHINLTGLQIQLEDIELKDKYADINFRKLQFKERCGFRLDDLAFKAEFSEKELNIEDLQLLTEYNELYTSVKMTFPHPDSLFSSPLKNVHADIRISPSTLSLQDAFYFNDSLRYDSLMQRIAPYPLELESRIEGSLADLDINKFQAKWLRETQLTASGHTKGLPDIQTLDVRDLQVKLSSTAGDLAIIAPPDSNAVYPQKIQLNSYTNGDARNLTTDLDLETSSGNLNLKASLANLMNTPEYKGDLTISQLGIGEIAGIPDLEPVSLKMNFEGKGKTIEEMELRSGIDFQQLTFRGYNYSNLNISAQLKDQKAEAKLEHTDENLDFDLLVEGFVDSVKSFADIDLHLRGADLHDLHLTAANLKTALQLKARFEGNAKGFVSKLNLTNATFKQDDDTYRLDSLYGVLINGSSNTDLNISSPIIRGKLNANTSLQNLSSSLSSYLKQVTDSTSLTGNSFNDSLDMEARFTIANSPILSEIFLPGLNRMDTVTIEAAFKPAEEILHLKVRAPEIIYNESELQGLSLDFDSDGDTTSIAFGFDHLFSEPVEIYQTDFNMNVSGRSGLATFKVLHADEKEVFYSSAEITRDNESVRIHIDPDHLVLNRNPWEILPENSIELGKGQTIFSNFQIQRNEQQLVIRSDEQEALTTINFKNFKLAAIFSILNAEESPLTGFIGGELAFLNLNQTPAFTADIELKDLAVMDNELGTLALKANNKQQQNFLVDLSLKGPEIDFAVNGTYSTAGETQTLDMGVDIHKINLALIESFVPEQMENSSGALTGHFDLKGPLNGLLYEGKLNFDNATFTPVMLGTEVSLNNEEINVDNDGVYFDRFTIKDKSNNTIVLDGQVLTENMLSPSFDLTLKADKFQLLNSTEEDNELFYGNALINLDITVKGDLNLPVADANVRLLNGTEITYVVPASQAQMQERKGIVAFKDMKDSTFSILNEEETNTSLMQGLDISAYLEIDPKTKFIVVVDPQSGDNLTVTGEAKLDFELTPNGNMSLTGAYELKDGAYKLSLYELVKKEFNIVPGSRIEWNGDPMDATLNITAMYKIETAPTDLFSDQLAGADAGTLNRYKQKVPFEVMLYIEGDLNSPKISFGLDMPDNSKNVLGGSVYGRVQQLNEDESELNKQVFSLIVFNKFLPSDATNSSGGGTSELARSSVSRLLSNQLNNLSEKYIQGVELNFDLDSYTDYQTGAAEQRTDLNVSLKRGFFDDRVVVEVGSQVGVEGRERENSEVVGDVSVEYLLQENGRYRLRAFRQNQYQDLIEGQVIITGLAILFNKEFDTWREFLKKDEPPVDTDEEEENKEEEESGNVENGKNAVEEKNETSPDSTKDQPEPEKEP